VFRIAGFHSLPCFGVYVHGDGRMSARCRWRCWGIVIAVIGWRIRWRKRPRFGSGQRAHCLSWSFLGGQVNFLEKIEKRWKFLLKESMRKC
jgi:hypothetical protein